MKKSIIIATVFSVLFILELISREHREVPTGLPPLPTQEEVIELQQQQNIQLFLQADVLEETDPQEARRLYELILEHAEENSNSVLPETLIETQYNTAHLYHSGTGVEQDLNKALSLYGAVINNPQTPPELKSNTLQQIKHVFTQQFNQAMILLKDTIHPENAGKAAEILKKIITDMSPYLSQELEEIFQRCLLESAIMHVEGVGLEKNFNEAIGIFNQLSSRPIKYQHIQETSNKFVTFIKEEQIFYDNLLQLAKSYHQANDFIQAKKVYQEILTISKKNPGLVTIDTWLRTLFNLAKLNIDNLNFDEALQLYHQVINNPQVKKEIKQSTQKFIQEALDAQAQEESAAENVSKKPRTT